MSVRVGQVIKKSTHCRRGKHEFTPENTRVCKKNGKKYRQCQKCYDKAVNTARHITITSVVELKRRVAALERAVNGVSEAWNKEDR
jgi:hypothetical protein